MRRAFWRTMTAVLVSSLSLPALADGEPGQGWAPAEPAQMEPVNRFPSVEINGMAGHGSSEFGIQTALPLVVRDNRMLFLGADATLFERGFSDALNGGSGDWVYDTGAYLGLRHAAGASAIGVWAGLDLQHTVFGNHFTRGIAGVSFDTSRYIVRASGFVPLRDEASAGAIGTEYAPRGLDADLMLRFPFASVFHAGGTDELRIGGGGFYYSGLADDNNFGGYRLRAELDVWAPAMMRSGGRVSFETQYEHDEVRDGTWTGGLRLTFPLGAPQPSVANLGSLKDGDGMAAPAAAAANFGTPVRRSRSIVTVFKKAPVPQSLATVVTNKPKCVSDADCTTGNVCNANGACEASASGPQCLSGGTACSVAADCGPPPANQYTCTNNCCGSSSSTSSSS